MASLARALGSDADARASSSNASAARGDAGGGRSLRALTDINAEAGHPPALLRSHALVAVTIGAE